VAKSTGKNASKLPTSVEESQNPELFQKYKQAEEELIKKEESKPYIKRNVEGDASETGLLKFIQPLLMDGPNGCYNLGGIDGLRKRYPVVPGVSGDPSIIPFSSDIKFNLIIRDMNTSNKTPDSPEDNMFVFLKGAPERVLSRCSTMLVNG